MLNIFVLNNYLTSATQFTVIVWADAYGIQLATKPVFDTEEIVTSPLLGVEPYVLLYVIVGIFSKGVVNLTVAEPPAHTPWFHETFPDCLITGAGLVPTINSPFT